jgi:hypothetical protein
MSRFLSHCTVLALVFQGLFIFSPSPGEAAFVKDYLIWDPDLNKNSGPIIEATLKKLGFCGDYEPGTESDIASYTFTDYAAIFYCLGTYPDNHVMTGTAAGPLESYMIWTQPPDTPHAYMEGGDTWAYDPRLFVHNMFRVDTLSEDGYGDLDMISGVTGNCTEGLGFQYLGDNRYIDRLKLGWSMPPDTAVFLFENGPDSVYHNAIGWKALGRQYISIASSFEFGGIESGFQEAVMESIMCYFEMDEFIYPLDASALRVIKPGRFSPPFVPLFPEIELRNAGSSSATFEAHCEIIPGGYTSAVTIINMPPGLDSIVQFPTPWIPDTSCSIYDITMWVELAGDLKDCNDTTANSTQSWNAVFAIKSPYTTSSPSIDGSLLPGEWADAESLDVSDILDRAGTGAVGCNSSWMYVKNDSTNIYLAIDALKDATFLD